jgi:hypothetical protein
LAAAAKGGDAAARNQLLLASLIDPPPEDEEEMVFLPHEKPSSRPGVRLVASSALFCSQLWARSW